MVRRIRLILWVLVHLWTSSLSSGWIRMSPGFHRKAFWKANTSLLKPMVRSGEGCFMVGLKSTSKG
ncbi:hypothetical protein DY000_02027510 [Brassica cretica]|uniref:Uncharacterized protein n=1 Tax=Brassica cretica TaxID=69181 RepID=A0ABQ7EJN0_BRACR|nr:hypothetical protein DY000_02027510 [Brassica cretica]